MVSRRKPSLPVMLPIRPPLWPNARSMCSSVALVARSARPSQLSSVFQPALRKLCTKPGKPPLSGLVMCAINMRKKGVAWLPRSKRVARSRASVSKVDMVESPVFPVGRMAIAPQPLAAHNGCLVVM